MYSQVIYLTTEKLVESIIHMNTIRPPPKKEKIDWSQWLTSGKEQELQPGYVPLISQIPLARWWALTPMSSHVETIILFVMIVPKKVPVEISVLFR